MTKPKLSKWTFTLSMLFLLNSVLFSLALFALTREKETAGVYGLRYLQQDSWQDSWGPMYKAIEHLREHPDVPIYSKLFFTDHTKFQYPLSSLLPLDLLQRIANLSQETLFQVLNTASWWFVILTGITSWLIFRESHRTTLNQTAEAEDQSVGLSSLIPVVAITITFYPLAKSYTLGQIQTAITMLVAMSLLAWQWKKPWLSGILLGICCAIKPQWAVVILWGLIRKEWLFVGTSGITFAGLNACIHWDVWFCKLY